MWCGWTLIPTEERRRGRYVTQVRSIQESQKTPPIKILHPPHSRTIDHLGIGKRISPCVLFRCSQRSMAFRCFERCFVMSALRISRADALPFPPYSYAVSLSIILPLLHLWIIVIFCACHSYSISESTNSNCLNAALASAKDIVPNPRTFQQGPFWVTEACNYITFSGNPRHITNMHVRRLQQHCVHNWRSIVIIHSAHWPSQKASVVSVVLVPFDFRASKSIYTSPFQGLLL